YLPENLRPKTVTRKSGKTVIYWLYRTHGKTEISLGTNRNEAFIKAAQLNIERESQTARITFGLVAKRLSRSSYTSEKSEHSTNRFVQDKQSPATL
ncbi:phage integrase Arm DNA-binding domain-containing protein, partial [Mannheimia haemolytica]|nr:phage integrase Arm DNA-binding domain-containing protein [Mannheimia haemolytica]